MELKQIEAEFESPHGGAFMCRSGAGRKDGVTFSRKKLCFVATDKAFLAELLLDLSRRSDCYYVKYSREPRDGMYLGRCFMLNDRRVGELWQEFKRHPRLMCTIQDDDFTFEFRSQDGHTKA
jgi:hypothetical protein